MVTRVHTLSLSMVAAAALVACGGGSSGSAVATNTTTTTAPTLSGVVVDGLIEGADVCLDLNNNQSCDSGEPSAKTDAKGSYQLDITGLSVAQLKNAHIFVTVPETAKDADDGGKTLKDAGKAAFNLLAPAEAVIGSDGKATGTVAVTPLTTMVSHTMLLDGSSADAAKGKVRTALGLATSVDITANFVGKTDDTSKDLAKKAQFLAASLGQVAKAIGSEQTTSSPQQRFMGALAHLKTNAKKLVDTAAAASGKTPVEAVKAALEDSTLKPVTATLLETAKSNLDASPVIGAVTTAFDSLIKEGFYDGYCSQSSYDTGTGGAQGTYSCSNWHIYATKSVADGKWESTKYYIKSTETAFSKIVPDPQYYEYTLVEGAGWVAKNANPSTGTYAADSTGLITVTRKLTDTKSQTFKTRMVAKDVGGKTLGEIGSAGAFQDMLKYVPSLKDTKLPAGSKLILGKPEYTEDTYGLNSKQVSVYNYNCSVQPCTSTYLTSFSELLSQYATPSGTATPSGSNLYWFWTGSSGGQNVDGPWYAGTFDSEGKTDAGGNMTVWKQAKEWNATGNYYDYKWTKVDGEKSTYTIKTVAGEKILLVNLSASPMALRVKNTGTTARSEQIFAVRDGKLYDGWYNSAQVQNEHQGGGNWNKTAAETIAKAMGASSLPQ